MLGKHCLWVILISKQASIFLISSSKPAHLPVSHVSGWRTPIHATAQAKQMGIFLGFILTCPTSNSSPNCMWFKIIYPATLPLPLLWSCSKMPSFLSWASVGISFLPRYLAPTLFSGSLFSSSQPQWSFKKRSYTPSQILPWFPIMFKIKAKVLFVVGQAVCEVPKPPSSLSPSPLHSSDSARLLFLWHAWFTSVFWYFFFSFVLCLFSRMLFTQMTFSFPLGLP